MKTLLTVINRNKNHESHKVYPYSVTISSQNHTPYIGTTSKKHDGGTILLFILAYIVCNCIFCPVCFLICSPIFYYIKITIYPPISPTSSPTYDPSVYSIINNYTY